MHPRQRSGRSRHPRQTHQVLESYSHCTFLTRTVRIRNLSGFRTRVGGDFSLEEPRDGAAVTAINARSGRFDRLWMARAISLLVVILAAVLRAFKDTANLFASDQATSGTENSF